MGHVGAAKENVIQQCVKGLTDTNCLKVYVEWKFIE